MYSQTYKHEDAGAQDNKPVTSDFVKKLFKMLEDPSFRHAIAWGPGGDSFDIKDINEFTNVLLPRMFNHSNFASFVRQLNKYNFHKLKTYDDVLAEPKCTYRHPDFRAGRSDLLVKLRRQTSSEQKYNHHNHTHRHIHSPRISVSRSGSSHSPSPSPSQVDMLKAQVETLTKAQESMTRHIEDLEKKYSQVLSSLAEVEKPPPMADSFTGVQPSSSSQFMSNSIQNASDSSTFDPAGDLALMGFAFGEGWNGFSNNSPSDMFLDMPTTTSVSVSPYLSASPMSSTFSPPDCSTMPLDQSQQYTNTAVLQNLVDSACGMVPCGGVKRSLEDSDPNDTWGSWKRARVEVN